MERRNTIQKELVLETVNTMKRHVTAEEIYNYIHEDHPSVGKGTVYRNLGVLVEEGKVRKVEVPCGPDRFDFTLKPHYHIVCTRCGDVQDVDMDPITDLVDRVHDKRGYLFTGYDILFKGICPACLKEA